jgi:hypothetical protein
MATIQTVTTGYRLDVTQVHHIYGYDAAGTWQDTGAVRRTIESRLHASLARAEAEASHFRRLAGLVPAPDLYPEIADVQVVPVLAYEVLDRDGTSQGRFGTQAEAERVAALVAAGYPGQDAYRQLRQRLVAGRVRRGEYTYPAVQADACGLERIYGGCGRVWALADQDAELPEGWYRVGTQRELPDEVEAALWDLVGPIEA